VDRKEQERGVKAGVEAASWRGFRVKECRLGSIVNVTS
jgi:hypothetical protein